MNFREKGKILYSMGLVRTTVSAVGYFLSVQKALGVSTPIQLSCALLNIKGFQIADERRAFLGSGGHPLDKSELDFSPIQLTDYEFSPVLLRPLFDRLWNACGYEKSADYDDKGQLKP